jgi:endoribonuclease Dicer
LSSRTGDAFLKYLASIYVFVTSPEHKEGTLHIHRQRIISNRSLLQNANRSGLPPYIQAKSFSFRLWQPPNFSVLSNDNEHPAQPENDETSAIPPPDAPESESPNNPQNSPLEAADMSSAREEGKVPAESSKHKRKSKRQKQQEDQNNQWLGDKVHLTIIIQHSVR